MQLTASTFLATALTAVSVHASALPPVIDTSPNPLVRRQGNPWTQDECKPEVKGIVLGGSTLQMLRNTWNNHFNGDFGGTGGNSDDHGVCCWGQCLWVEIRGPSREWNGDQWGDAFRKMVDLVGDQERGFCGVSIKDDPYLILASAQHDSVSLAGKKIGELLGDTCKGSPPW